MVNVSPEAPVDIKNAAYGFSDDGLMTLAAFLLAAGVWFRRLEYEAPVLPTDDMVPLGLAEWHLADDRTKPFEPSAAVFPTLADDSAIADPKTFRHALGMLVYEAYYSRRADDLAQAVAMGTASPDALVRICALASAFDMFSFSFAERVRRLTTFDFSESETTSTIAAILLARTFGFALSATNKPPPPVASVTASPGLMLIHGTNFPPHRPTWSVPGTGLLFNHIAGFRRDIYGASDFFRWEGGYGDYAREVAAMNLGDWIQRRGLTGLDAVTHSHGGNVLMAATHQGIDFDRVVFLSCPVHWHRYQPRMGSIRKAQSVRIRLDFVILADRAAQRFPTGTIPEHILPVWFVSHGATTEPGQWRSESLDRYIR